jgi:hypothetical protein|nr:hypothetical protein [uncultured Lamprocystis sp.]
MEPDELRHVLQLAIAVAHAGRAVLVVIGQQQFDLQALCFARPARAGLDSHPRLRRGDARGGQQRLLRGRRARDLDQADAAGAGCMVDVVEFAQTGDVESMAAGTGEDGLVGQGLDGLPVDRQEQQRVGVGRLGHVRPLLPESAGR